MIERITAIFYTANQIPERFARPVREHLLQALDGIPLISVSQKPLPGFGENLVVPFDEPSVSNLYRQLLYGAMEARSRWVAFCEDDVLYTKEHFAFRPVEFAYNHNRWGLYTWLRDPVFSFKDRSVLNQGIARRDVLITALRERLNHQDPKGRPLEECLHEPGRYEKRFGLTEHTLERFHSPEPSVVFSHLHALNYTRGNQQGLRKKLGDFKVRELAPWGTAEEMLLKYIGKEEWQRQIAIADEFELARKGAVA